MILLSNITGSLKCISWKRLVIYRLEWKEMKGKLSPCNKTVKVPNNQRQSNSLFLFNLQNLQTHSIKSYWNLFQEIYLYGNSYFSQKKTRDINKFWNAWKNSEICQNSLGKVDNICTLESEIYIYIQIQYTEIDQSKNTRHQLFISNMTIIKQPPIFWPQKEHANVWGKGIKTFRFNTTDWKNRLRCRENMY